MTPMTFFTRLPAFAGASKLCGFCRDAHALPHEEQSCVHSSVMEFTSILSRHYRTIRQPTTSFVRYYLKKSDKHYSIGAKERQGRYLKALPHNSAARLAMLP